MNWTQADLDAMNKAIATGTSTVRFADNREVTDLEACAAAKLAEINADLAPKAVDAIETEYDALIRTPPGGAGGGPPHRRRAARPHKIEGIATATVKAAFLRIGVDLADNKSVPAFNATSAHAERGRGFWDKVGATALTVVVTAIFGLIFAALGKYSWPTGRVASSVGMPDSW
ncbi:hypothetical protein [Methylobacterium soli]|uniref:Uncharacterized protein n=1 Tax=Methylobacterium soli TaxID=553447 RepID=A0A6L3SPT5_9HYPH|nr:hypothetical protein [Methylobacterium soli]KAB1072238.1 hypothetical protein F6X53_28450 [Methylobacterium soli]GJE45312.1 hypothetical protein AEGHOMDF_4506 [Methylobacterium soli]